MFLSLSSWDPVADSLDELPDHDRRRAVNRINDVLDGDRPVVLTCRGTEYEDLIAGGAPTLSRAPVVRINPVATPDVVSHLRAWPEVAEHVAREPDGPVATALSTPLMVSLFVAAYKDRSPAELLDPSRFASRHAVEDHLVDLLVDVHYPDPKHRRWLSYLAEVLHRNDDHDFRWWQLARRTLSPWTAPVLGLLVAVVVFAIAEWLYHGLGNAGPWLDTAATPFMDPPQFATIFGVMVTVLWLTSGGREPGPVAAEPGVRGFWRGVLTGAALVLVPGVPILLLSTGVLHPTRPPTENMPSFAGALLGLAVVAGLGVGLHEVLAARTSRVGQAGPEEFLRQDRRSSLTSAAVTGIVVGALTIATATLGAALGGHLGQRFTSTEHGPVVVNLDLPPLQTHVPWLLDRAGLPGLVVQHSLPFVVLFAVAVLATRAWTRFLVARAVLALTGRLPWRLMRFLADARERGLLRVAGGGYQFWHVRLQERLVMTAANRRPRKRLPRAAVAGIAVLPALVVVAVASSAEPPDCQDTGWSEVDSRMARVTYQGVTGCFASIANDWRRLQQHQADEPMLEKIAQIQPLPSDRTFDQVTVVGDFHTVNSARWREILRGLTAAQDIHPEPLVVEFAHSDIGSQSSEHHAALVRRYLMTPAVVPGRGTAVTIDGTGSTVLSQHHRQPWPVIGLRDTGLTSISTRFADAMVAEFKGPPRGPDTAAKLTDGISDEECAALRQAYESQPDVPVALDLRDAHCRY